ncbi:Asp-tRNA(Asn)/Glu-tRNA(Gln) amidotransferase subunit GatA [Salinarchaeum sp. IM2453]|uniref:Asp-tRNA(Asn)/Glu-tRNA(Gln) amidotransferase subunit GatA n=1 Tax=Salinarchaeum sp. IM2453 TaxID=2862870 RepID=UPI001C8403AC|nr:Asp-tRNA(Asn)/Glu-tRNA(Gln) amidotransferase subunit GatA [Salinarchaeum sp. IM2453]QZA88144.1 Asp-tRNA(Asn)/Glu-tRNA(Gln) amidotransferase subunit GatA [Salinarchaeum sp. IM2453]
MSENIFLTETEVESTADGKLSGYTIAVKDNIATENIRTTCGSAMLADYEPPFDATVVDRVKSAGGTIVGKANLDEFGMGTTTETSAFGPTENPVAPGYVPGGSSGGSAAAVAAGEADIALGSDTGGSIRCPAAFCNVVGIKPTYGLVSRYGLIAYANSLEQIGPIAQTVDDAARLLDVIAGSDPKDATTREEGDHTVYTNAVDGDIDGLQIGIPSQLLDGVDEDVKESFWSAIDELEAAGATYQEISLPSVKQAVQAYYVIAMSEASSNLARFDGVRYGHSGGFDGNWNKAFSKARREGFGDEVKRRILLGTFALSAGYQDKYYKQAQDARAWVKQDFDESFETVDIIASPTMPMTPFELGETIDDPMKMYLADTNTTPVNLADLPAISVPIEKADGLPVGLQLVGPAFDEETIIRAGSVLA